jgi:uncharacterized membrane protein YeaQ/YmgE (transglycosylase-associated protein family)
MIYTILVGGLVGWLAGKLMKGGGFGPVKNILLGIVGGVIGHWVMSLLKVIFFNGLLGDIMKGLVGAILILFLADYFKKK